MKGFFEASLPSMVVGTQHKLSKCVLKYRSRVFHIIKDTEYSKGMGTEYLKGMGLLICLGHTICIISIDLHIQSEPF